MQPCIHIKLEPSPDQDSSGNKKLNRGHKVYGAHFRFRTSVTIYKSDILILGK